MTALLGAFVRRLALDPLGAQAVVRGSQVTSRWVPGRTTHDLDLLLLDGPWTIPDVEARLRAVVARVDGSPALHARAEVIWADTPSPGLRLHVGAEGEPAGLQVDMAWGDPLAAEPVAFELAGVALRGVVPEVMYGWKAHGLVEFGRGRWSPKTLADLALIPRHVALDDALTRRAVALAFGSRGTELAALDVFFDDPSWGTSRNSRRKWTSFQRRHVWNPGALPDVVAEVRAVLARYVPRGRSPVADTAR